MTDIDFNLPKNYQFEPLYVYELFIEHFFWCRLGNRNDSSENQKKSSFSCTTFNKFVNIFSLFCFFVYSLLIILINSAIKFCVEIVLKNKKFDKSA